MARLRDILGINERSAEYLRLNRKRARKRADDKLRTKRLLEKFDVPHPRLLGKLVRHKDVYKFDWSGVEGGFVIKPSQGLGGNGIMVIKKRELLSERKENDRPRWILMDGSTVDADDLQIHALDIVEGRYSRSNIPDRALVEERVKIHPKFRKLGKMGTPDVRVIVFNKVPVMAMLRIPTAESKGKANLHQGAIGLGVDITTGITTYGVYKDQRIKYFPGTSKKVNGIAVPNWNDVLLRAVKTQIASELGYVAVDMLIDEEKGPLVLELNDQPGLAIQIANMSGLKRRLERVEGLEVEDAEKGVKVAKTLFASRFASRVKALSGEKRKVGIFETVKIKVGKKKRVEVPAKIDTGAYSTSIDMKLAEELGLLKHENILWTKKFKSALGEQDRLVIRLVFWLQGKKIVTRAGLTNRKDLRRKVLVGRRDLKEFIVEPSEV